MMITSRRNFITGCSVLVGAAVAPAGVFLPVSKPILPRTKALGLTDFSSLKGSLFKADISGKPHHFKLQKVVVWPDPHRPENRHAGLRTEQFSLFFRGRKGVGQDTYSFEHQELGLFSMFIVPVGRNYGDYAQYEAVFSRLLPEGVPT